MSLLYCVHPGDNPLSGDPYYSAKQGIESRLPHFKHKILIPPARWECYVEDDHFTTIRDEPTSTTWVRPHDLAHSSEDDVITLIGGKLQLCLGNCLDSVLKIAQSRGHSKLSVDLPFDAIYTYNGFTAEQEYRSLLGTGANEAFALALLLGSADTNYMPFRDREDVQTALFLNGECVLGPENNAPFELQLRATTKTKPRSGLGEYCSEYFKQWKEGSIRSLVPESLCDI